MQTTLLFTYSIRILPMSNKIKKLGLRIHKRQRIIRDYYQQHYANKMDNLDEMDKFLEKYNFPKLNQEEIEDLNRAITSKEIKTVIRNLPANKAQDQMASELNSTKSSEKS